MQSTALAILKQKPKDRNQSLLLSLDDKTRHSISEQTKQFQATRKRTKQRKQNLLKGYNSKPASQADEHEKQLLRLARKGVVKFFNELQKQQDRIDETKNRHKSDAAKDQFLQALTQQKVKEEEKKPAFLKNSFLAPDKLLSQAKDED
ncbi:hypothetical protein BLNAU_7607 [Blattamonas nauphoetae]|uniref:Uncharacterized protein n=1 Tax=Blattamonas nauphoetae TaxID=2049346 RepID=A0ABQ9Y128_9EUKA|nr:hypothetical protein BLNAU_7607 [Blattamonas nauphoetae]